MRRKPRRSSPAHRGNPGFASANRWWPRTASDFPRAFTTAVSRHVSYCLVLLLHPARLCEVRPRGPAARSQLSWFAGFMQLVWRVHTTRVCVSVDSGRSESTLSASRLLRGRLPAQRRSGVSLVGHPCRACEAPFCAGVCPLTVSPCDACVAPRHGNICDTHVTIAFVTLMRSAAGSPVHSKIAGPVRWSCAVPVQF